MHYQLWPSFLTSFFVLLKHHEKDFSPGLGTLATIGERSITLNLCLYAFAQAFEGLRYNKGYVCRIQDFKQARLIPAHHKSFERKWMPPFPIFGEGSGDDNPHSDPDFSAPTELGSTDSSFIDCGSS
ncbi:hypothetical protein EBS43_04755 [bacterium]|nr:hypothetical protein [bacterium]